MDYNTFELASTLAKKGKDLRSLISFLNRHECLYISNIEGAKIHLDSDFIQAIRDLAQEKAEEVEKEFERI